MSQLARPRSVTAVAALADIALGVIALGAVACSESTSPKQRDVPTAVHVVAAHTLLGDGDTATLSAVVTGQRGDTLATAPVAWSTTDAAAVTVDAASGRVTAVTKGSAWVVASIGTARDSVQVMVGYRKISGPEPFVSVSLFLQTFQPGDGCALTAQGTAYCWGSNRKGQLGDGGTQSSTTPVPVAGGLLFADLQAGNQGACGLTKGDGALYCWGSNAHAQFGTSSRVPLSSNVPLLGPPTLRFSAFSLSPDGTTCGVSKADAALYCWGNDTYWTTGKDTSVDLLVDAVVAPVTGGLRATQVDVGELHGCAVGSDGAVWCWGKDGTTYGAATNSRVPVKIVPPGTIASVTSGEYATCGLASDGQALCWGSPLVAPGADPSAVVPAPTAVGGALRFRKLSSSFRDFECGLTTGGDIYCWGSNGSSGTGVDALLGRAGPSAPASAPVPVLPGRKFVDVDQWCAVDVAGSIYCWH
ncbi:MAG TPA: hypothetical protein VFJ74_03510 [Gemmatimonadaceae bacterium]|nr:hypothetical protein [Gemmatimonadaceae bacterium]